MLVDGSLWRLVVGAFRLKKPSAENYPELWAWLENHKARRVWQLPYNNGLADQTIECWMIGCRLVIIWLQRSPFGWMIYTDSPSGRPADTFADAEQRLGLKSQRKGQS
jgi:hypothetical protein